MYSFSKIFQLVLEIFMFYHFPMFFFEWCVKGLVVAAWNLLPLTFIGFPSITSTGRDESLVVRGDKAWQLPSFHEDVFEFNSIWMDLEKYLN